MVLFSHCSVTDDFFYALIFLPFGFVDKLCLVVEKCLQKKYKGRINEEKDRQVQHRHIIVKLIKSNCLNTLLLYSGSVGRI